MTIILLLEYDGTNYYGWQIQNAQRTIQGELNKAVRKAFNKPYQVVGAGRTDAGVHSSGMVAHIEFDDDEIKIPRHKVRLALNKFLPIDIRIKRLWFSSIPFHSRFDVEAREYRYRFSRYPSVFKRRYSAFIPYNLDVEKLFECCKFFLGKHNFHTFSKNHSDVLDYFCEVQKCEWVRINETDFELSIIADRYVYGMVRAIVGMMLEVARNKKTFEDINNALTTEDRSLQAPLAPAEGLDLHRIYYKEPFDMIK